MNKNSLTTTFPQLPIISLSTADEISTTDLPDGRLTIVGESIRSIGTNLTFGQAQPNSLNEPLSFSPFPSMIDFWTTKCVKCPSALDKLNGMAMNHPDEQFVSICCDSLDGAREILERDDELRWSRVQHFFMSKEDKEAAKKMLGFKQVPFYVVLGEDGQLLEKGNHVDLHQYLADKENVAQGNAEEDVFVIDDLDF